MRVFEKVPPLLQQGETKKDWENRRKVMVETVAAVEYGRRPEMDYQVSWNLCSRETVLDGEAERLITDITVSTEFNEKLLRFLMFANVQQSNCIIVFSVKNFCITLIYFL